MTYAISSYFNLVLNVTSLPRLIVFEQRDSVAKLNRKRHDQMPCVAARISVVREYKPVSLSAFPITVCLRSRLTLS